MSNLKYKSGDKIKVWAFPANSSWTAKPVPLPFDRKNFNSCSITDYELIPFEFVISSQTKPGFSYAIDCEHHHSKLWGFNEGPIIELVVDKPKIPHVNCLECGLLPPYPVVNLTEDRLICFSCRASYSWKYSDSFLLPDGSVIG